MTVNIPPEILAAIQAVKSDLGLASDSAAAAYLIQAGAKAQGYLKDGVVSVTKWGGQRYYQCPQCGGWNIGEVDGVKRCADCGWNS